MKTKIDVISGFLGAGKTSLIKKLIADIPPAQRVVILQNEHGEVAIHHSELEGKSISLEEVTGGCACCHGAGDFIHAVQHVIDWAAPERILLELSGTARLSGVLALLADSFQRDAAVSGVITVVDADKFDLCLRNYQGFYDDQLKSSPCILLRGAERKTPPALDAIVSQIQALNPSAAVLTASWDALPPERIRQAMQYKAASL